MALLMVLPKMKAAIGDFTKSYSPRLKEQYKLIALGHSTVPDFAWWAPEQVKDMNQPPTTATDVYAFASTIVECLTLKKPFGKKASTWREIYERVTNTGNEYPELTMRRPDRPESRWMTDRLWQFILKCWGDAPGDRPQVGELVVELYVAQKECSLRNA